MRRYRLALALSAAAALVFLAVVPGARRAGEKARAQQTVSRQEIEQLRVRLADLGRRTTGDEGATATDGVTAARALRLAFLEAAEGLKVSGVEVRVNPLSRGAMAATGILAAEGSFTEVLRLARRLADPSSGLLLDRVSLGTRLDNVRLEAEAFILKEES